jgi:hypothetical protein
METEIERLREQHPKLYGVLRSDLEEVAEAIERCSYRYPLGKQVRESIRSPTASAREYGQALTGLAKLEIIDVYTERTNSNRYDLTALDSDRLRSLQRSIADTVTE